MSQSKIDQVFGSFQKQTNEFETLKLTMEEFVNDIDLKLSNKQSIYLNQQQQHKQQIQELNQITKNLQSEIRKLDEKESQTTIKLNEALHNLESSNLKIEELQSQKQNLINKKTQQETLITSLKQQIIQGQSQLTKTTKDFEHQFQLNLIELSKYELYTGLKIKPKSINEILFSFFNLNPENNENEYSILLGIDDDLYKVLKTEPSLPNDKVDELCDELNKHQRLIRFLKGIRNLFKSYIDGEL
ncbi:SPC25 [Candida jiufengensis]|uniref:SPC25 n=1 Tax=Candida jiufengensis TaxID=497108 RepID=UPI00222488C4|nr:SPC25 [Candida jiufengensis]KAI5957112.1 SPC25 [Candida jiufengensis]